MNDIPRHRPFLESSRVSHLLNPQAEPPDTRSALEDVAVKTGTPVEVLYAMGEAAGARTPGEFHQIAQQAGQTLGPRFQAGEGIEDVVRSFSGGDDNAVNEFMGYARQINQQLYPDDWATVEDTRSGWAKFWGSPSQYPRALAQGAIASVGATVEGVGLIASKAGMGSNAVQRAGRAVVDYAGEIGPSAERSGIVTDVVAGVGSMLNYLIPGAAAMWLTRGAGRGAQWLASRGTASAFAGPAGASEQYNRAIAAGLSEEEALGWAMYGIPGGILAITSIGTILRAIPPQARGNAVGQMRHVAEAFGAEFAAEGASALWQNWIEQSYNPERGLWDDTLYQAMIGGSSAAVIQTLISAATKGKGFAPPSRREYSREEVEEAARNVFGEQGPEVLRQAEANAAQAAAAAPQPVPDGPLAGAVSEATEPGPAAPAGPLGATMEQEAPAPVAGDMRPGESVTIEPVDPETGELGEPLSTRFVREDLEAESLIFADERGEFPVPRAEIDAGLTMIQRQQAETGRQLTEVERRQREAAEEQAERERQEAQREAEKQAAKARAEAPAPPPPAAPLGTLGVGQGGVDADLEADASFLRGEAPAEDGPVEPVRGAAADEPVAEPGAGGDDPGGEFAGAGAGEAVADAGRAGEPDDALNRYFIPPPDPNDLDGPMSLPRNDVIRATLRDAEEAGGESLTVPERRAIIARLDAEGGDAREAIVDELTRTIQNETGQPVVAVEDESVPFGDPGEDARFGGEPEAAQDGRPADEAAGRGGPDVAEPAEAPVAPAAEPSPPAAPEPDARPAPERPAAPQEDSPDAAPVAPAAPPEAPAQADADGADPIEGSLRAAIAAGEVGHTTKKGKALTGYIARGISREQAKEVDPFTFAKDGGFFIRKAQAEADFPQGEAPTPPEAPASPARPELQDGWSNSIIKARQAAKTVGLTKAEAGDAWRDRDALVRLVNERLPEDMRVEVAAAPAEGAEPAGVPPVEDARRLERMRGARQGGRQAAAEGEPREVPDFLKGTEMADEWLAGYAEGLAAKSPASDTPSSRLAELSKALATIDAPMGSPMRTAQNLVNSAMQDLEAGNTAAAMENMSQAERRLRQNHQPLAEVLDEIMASLEGAETAPSSEIRSEPAAGAAPDAPAEPAAPSAAPEPAAAPEPKRQSLSSLSKKEQDRAALLRARIADRLRNQTSSGVDPAILQDAIELAGLYIKDGYRKFRALLNQVAEDMGLTPKEAEPWVRVAYNEARDSLELDGQDVSDMDDSRAVLAEARKVRTEPEAPAVESEDAADIGVGDQRVEEAGESGQPAGQPEGDGPDSALAQESPQDGGGDGAPRGAGGAGARPERPAVRGDDGAGSVGDADTGRPGDQHGELADDGPGERVTPPAATRPNYNITDPAAIVGGGPKARFRRNRAAIEALHEIEATGREPTAAELDAMAGYTGWGAFGQELFQGNWNTPRPKDGWQAEDAWLREHLGKEGWESAQRSIINAHYTDPPTVTAMWDMVRRMGFKGGRVLEPSMGVGNFFGLMPRDLMSNSDLTGIELDTTTGGMAKMLYPDANISIKGYERSLTADGFYDLVIGNWPFAKQGPADRRYDKLSPSLHDYFFLKALDQTRAGGLVVGVTSSGTMDKKTRETRIEIAKKADLVAAYRLPTGAFQEYAGTKVVTDILVFRKRAQPNPAPAREAWVQTAVVAVPNGEVEVNQHFIDNPDAVLGTLNFGSGTTQGRAGMIVDRADNFREQLEALPGRVPEGAYEPRKASREPRHVVNNTEDRQNSIVKHSDGEIYVVRGERLELLNDLHKWQTANKKQTARRADQIERMVDLRKAYGALIDAERTGATDAEAKRKALKKLYDGFVAEHGPVSKAEALKVFEKVQDSAYAMLAALDGSDGKPAAILSRPVSKARRKVDNPTVRDAYVIQRNESITVDVDAIAELAGVDREAAVKQLREAGLIYRKPGGAYEAADVFLSGNVRQRLREAEAAQEAGEDMAAEIEALNKALPAPVPYFQIEARLGAPFVSSQLYREFVASMMGIPPGSDAAQGIDVRQVAGIWKVTFADKSIAHRSEVLSGYGTPEYRFDKLVTAAMGNQSVTIRKRDSDGNEYVDQDATETVNNKIADVREHFQSWVWAEPTRKINLENHYNEVMRSVADARFNGDFLEFPGIALRRGDDEFSLRKHQSDAIARGIINERGIYAHEVGTGKSYTIAGIAIESVRYGIAKKPLVFGHNANSASLARDGQEMYPGARVLYVDNLKPDEIATTVRRIRNDDWDMIVMPHSLIDRIGFKRETLEAFAAEEIAGLEAEAIAAANEDDASLTVADMNDPEAMKNVRSATAKELVKARNSIIANIEKQANRASREGAIPFEDLGIDMVLVDEAHEFKKPPITTRMKVKGLNVSPSDRSISLRFITDYIKSQRAGGTGVHLFTGTPITNTLGEMYHMMRYVMQSDMARDGYDSWDAWFNSFADTVTDVEVTSTGDYDAVTRLSQFVNVAELRRVMGQYLDVVFADDMPEFKPRETASGKNAAAEDLTDAERAELMDGRSADPIGRPYKVVRNEVAEMSPSQREVLAQVQEWAKQWKEASRLERRRLMQGGHYASPVVHDGIAAKASMDARLWDMSLPDDPSSKVNRAVKNVLTHYRESADGTQVIFMDTGYSDSAERAVRNASGMVERDGDTGKPRRERVPTLNLAKDIKEKLIAGGVPAEQIAIVAGGTSHQKKKQISEAMNTGEIRVVIGQTQTLGVGVNMQRNLRAMHHIDAPWMPGELEQRNGRGQRQGNTWNTVLEYRYITEGIDGRRWQILSIKDRFIKAFMRADDSVRVIEGDAVDMEDGSSDIAASLGEATGDPRIQMRAKLKNDVDRLERKERMHAAGAADAEREAGRLRRQARDSVKQSRAEEPVVRALADKINAKTFEANIEGQPFAERKGVDEAIAAAVEAYPHGKNGPRVKIGSVQGVDLFVEGPMWTGEPPVLSLQSGALSVNPAKNTLASIEANLRSAIRNYSSRLDHAQEQREAADRLEAQSKLPFGQAESLAARKKRLREVSVDLILNPAPAPMWLRQGAPTGTLIHVGGKAMEVTGHRWASDGYFITTDEGAIPYMQARDEAGMPLYTEQAFRPPVASGSERNIEIGGVDLSFAQDGSKILFSEARTGRRDSVDWAGFRGFESLLERQPGVKVETKERGRLATFPNAAARDAFLNRWSQDHDLPPIFGETTTAEVADEAPPAKTADEMRLEDDGAPATREMRPAPLAAAEPIARENMRPVAVALNEALRAMNVRANVRVVEAVVGALGQRVAGRAKGAEIQVSAEVGEAGALGVLRHEVIHILRDAALWGKPYGLFSQAEWRALVAAARADKAVMDRVAEAYPDLSETARLEEAVAEMFREWSAGMDARSTLGRAFQRVREFFRALASALNGEGFDTAGRVMQRIADGDVGARHRARDGKGRFMAREARGLTAWNAQVLEALTGRMRPEQTLTLGPVPEIVQRLGGRGGNLVMAAGKLRKVRKDHPEVSIEAIARLPYLIANPVFVFDNPGQQRTGDRLFVTDIVTGDDSVLVASIKRAGRDDAGNAATVVVTAYGKDRFTEMMEGAAKAGRVLYVRGEREGSGYKHTGANSLNAPLSGTMSSLRADRKILTPRRVFKDGVPPQREAGAREMRFPLARTDAAAEAAEQTVINRAVRAGSNTLTDLMGGKSDTYNLLALVPGRPLFAELGKQLPSAKKYLRTKEEMDALRNQTHAKTDQVVRSWQKAVAEAGGKWVPFSRGRKRAAKELADLMHDATIAGQDPSVRFKAPRRDKGMRDEDYQSLVAEKRDEYDALRARFRALPEGLQETFTTVRDTFREQADEFEAAVAEAAAKAMDIQAARARRRHQEELQQLRDEGLSGEALKEAEALAKRRLVSEVKRLEWARNARIRQLRLKFEANRVDDPYFPLMRWGNYFATVRDEDGAVVSFSKFESAAKQEAFRKEMEREGLTVETGVLGTDADMSRYVDPGFVADIQDMMRGEVGTESVMDAIWQRWLETLPDYSIRKSRIHRKGTPGFDGDALRAFAHQMFHGGHQLARLKYGMELTEHLENMRVETARASDPNRAGIIVNEMEKRHAWAMNPTGGAWATFFTSAAFVWYLGITPAAAMVNLSQTTVVGVPILTAGIKGATVGRTTRQLTRALRDFTAGKGWAQTSARLTADERAAMEEAYRRGTIDKSQAHDIAAVAESGVEYSAVRERIMRPIAFFFHHSERMNREVTFLAAYRMAKESGLEGDAALQKASDLTWKTHFDYSGSSKPRFMQSDPGKVLFVFRNFQINMVYRLWRDMHQTFKGKSEAERREARAQLVGITTSMFLHAGITGTWGYALLMTLAGMFFEGGRDEIEEELKRGVVETFGPGAGGLLLKGVPGHLTGADVSRRIGIPELWWRSPDRQLEGEAAYQFWLTELVGAVPSIALGMFRGLQWAGEGDIWRGVETAGPKFLRDQMRSIRYLQEGVTTRSGEPVVEDLTPQQALIQAIGFTPAQVSEQYEMNRRMRNIETRVSRERGQILRDVFRELQEGGPISARTMDRIQKFNREHPTWIITSSTVRQSIQARQRMSDQMDGGIRLTPRLDGAIRAQMAPAIYG